MLFPGTFDPFTRGHRDIARRASKLCDKLVIAVMENAAKKPMFTPEERVELIRLSLKNDDLSNVEVTVNIKGAYDAIGNATIDALGDMVVELSEQTLINLAPRLRMTTLYAVSQTVGGRVINTSNKSEAMTGYFTRWGDECGDMKPLINLLKNEVVAIGLTMPEIPRDLVEKAPSDGLTGKTDEDKIGFSYDALDTYIRGSRNEGDVDKKIEARIFSTMFKRKPIPAFDPWKVV
jgi:NAD+ synthase